MVPQLPPTFRRPNLPLSRPWFIRVAGGRPCLAPQLVTRLRAELEPAGWREARPHAHEVLRLWKPSCGQLVARYGSPHLLLSASLLIVEVGGRRADELERELLAASRTIPEVRASAYLTAYGRIISAQIECPYCGRRHTHGASAEGAAGPRQSHCSPGGEYFVIDSPRELAAARRLAGRRKGLR